MAEAKPKKYKVVAKGGITEDGVKYPGPTKDDKGEVIYSEVELTAERRKAIGRFVED